MPSIGETTGLTNMTPFRGPGFHAADGVDPGAGTGTNSVSREYIRGATTLSANRSSDELSIEIRGGLQTSPNGNPRRLGERTFWTEMVRRLENGNPPMSYEELGFRNGDRVKLGSVTYQIPQDWAVIKTKITDIIKQRAAGSTDDKIYTSDQHEKVFSLGFVRNREGVYEPRMSESGDPTPGSRYEIPIRNFERTVVSMVSTGMLQGLNLRPGTIRIRAGQFGNELGVRRKCTLVVSGEDSQGNWRTYVVSVKPYDQTNEYSIDLTGHGNEFFSVQVFRVGNGVPYVGGAGQPDNQDTLNLLDVMNNDPQHSFGVESSTLDRGYALYNEHIQTSFNRVNYDQVAGTGSDNAYTRDANLVYRRVTRPAVGGPESFRTDSDN